jgi:hypothetical protein
VGTRKYQLVGGEVAGSGNNNWAEAPAATGYGNSFWDAPHTPTSFDDEFLDGSPDLATRGWIVRDASTGATISWQGELQPYGALGGSGYQASITPSGLLIRPPNLTQGMAIYKLLDDLPAAVSIMAECYPSRGTSLAGTGFDLLIANQGLRFNIALKCVGTNWRSNGRANFFCNTGLNFTGFPVLTEDSNSAWGASVLDYTTLTNVPLGEVPGQTYASCVDPVAQRVAALTTMTHPSFFMPAAMGIIVQNVSPSDRLQFLTLRRMRRLAHRVWPGFY